MEKGIKAFRAGSISATVWSNTGSSEKGEFEFKTITIQKNYKDKNDVWQHTNSFTTGDLPKIRLLADKAYEYLVTKEAPDE
jgi:hypothetical protein